MAQRNLFTEQKQTHRHREETGVGQMERPEAYRGKWRPQKDVRTIERGKDIKWAMGPAKNVNDATHGLER